MSCVAVLCLSGLYVDASAFVSDRRDPLITYRTIEIGRRETCKGVECWPEGRKQLSIADVEYRDSGVYGRFALGYSIDLGKVSMRAEYSYQEPVAYSGFESSLFSIGMTWRPFW